MRYRRLLLALSMVFSVAGTLSAKSLLQVGGGTAEEATALTRQYRFKEAVAIYLKLLEANPDNMQLNRDCALALYRSGRGEDNEAKAQELRRKSRAYALKARQLGCTEALNDSLLSLLTEDGSFTDPGTMDPDKAVDKVLQQAEKAFAKGDMSEALRCYQAALTLNPKNYSATLYSGDVYFAWKRYDDAITWFSRAIKLDPDGDTAYRYLGDALLMQGKSNEALDNYITAIILRPYKKMVWYGLVNYSTRTKTKLQQPIIDLPKVSVVVSKDNSVSIVAEPQAGPLALAYALARTRWVKENPAKPAASAPSGYRHCLAEEAMAIRAMFKEDARLKSVGQAREAETFASSLPTLKSMDSEGLLEPFILLDHYDDGIAADYRAFRDEHRGLLVRYIRKYRLGLP